MSTLVRPEWMHACAACVELAEEFAAVEDGPASDELNAAWQMQDHLVAAHLGDLPGYRDDCEDCEEWQEIAASETPDVPPWWTVREIARGDLLHRANHVVWGE